MALSRRKLMMMGLGAGALFGIPAAQYAAWGSQNFERKGFSDPVPTVPEGEVRWTNWSGIQTSTPKQIFVPKTEQELAERLASTSGKIRPVGSGHSFTALVPTEDVIVDLARMNGIREYDLDTKTVKVGAGTRLRALAKELSQIGLGLKNMPDVDVQTLGGSFNTATHGAGLSLAAIHDYIIGFTMVTASGEVLNVTQDSNPDLFSAGKVGLGSLGVITEYTLKVETAFRLHKRLSMMPVEDILDMALMAAETHYGFEWFYLPGTGQGVVLSYDRTNEPIRRQEGMSKDEENELMMGLKDARDKLGWAPSIRRRVVAKALPKGLVEDQIDESWRLLSTTRPIKFNEMEYHLPIEHAQEAMREVIKRLDARKEIFFPIEVRFVANDDAWLSPFNHGPSVSIAVHAYHDEDYDYLFTDFEPLYKQFNGRPHWGKLHSLGAKDLRALYPRFDDFNALRTSMDPTGRFLNPHLDKLFLDEKSV